MHLALSICMSNQLKLLLLVVLQRLAHVAQLTSVPIHGVQPRGVDLRASLSHPDKGANLFFKLGGCHAFKVMTLCPIPLVRTSWLSQMPPEFYTSDLLVIFYRPKNKSGVTFKLPSPWCELLVCLGTTVEDTCRARVGTWCGLRDNTLPGAVSPGDHQAFSFTVNPRGTLCHSLS